MLKVAHRGASAYAPENTLTAFQKGVAMGADGIELDLHVCATGQLVVIHDDTVERTTNGKGNVADMTLAELKALRISENETIPTLEEVWEAAGPNAYYFLECKHISAMEETARIMAQQIKKGWDAEKLALISFRHAGLRAALAAFPELRIGASFEKLKANSVGIAQTLGAKMLLPKYTAVTKEYVEQAHAHNLQVITWTVNAPADIVRMREVGVDGIISDYPDRLMG